MMERICGKAVRWIGRHIYDGKDLWKSSPVDWASHLRWKGFVEKVGLKFGVKRVGVMDDESGDDGRDEHRWAG